MKRSLCNELFGSIPFWKQCEITLASGLEGIEIAPFTIADESYRFPSTLASSLKRTLDDFGLGFAGLHWLLTKPDGLLLTSKDAKKRQESLDFLLRLAEFSDRMGGGVMTLGGPKQRAAVDGVSVSEANAYLNEVFVEFGERTKGYVSRLAIEALSGDQTDVVNTFEEGRRILEGADGSRVTSMFDFHNTTEEKDSWETLIRTNMDIIS
ncbi:MAG: TIM barrel protein, partial [Spirochaetales bacterium]|nr:TIM barrel protein [Candidatus Physcosoma equi]